MELLARASVGDSTQKAYGQKWRAWCYARAAQGKSPWLLRTDGEEVAVVALTEFMALRCFTFKNQSTTIRGYLSAIKYYHKMFGGWDLPTDHHMVVAVGKGVDRAHCRSDVKPKVRKPLTWDMLVQGWGFFANRGREWSAVWMGLALSYHLLCRASEIWAYGNGLVHPDFCLTRRDVVFFRGTTRLAWKDRRRADKVEVTFRAGKSDQNRLGSVVPRNRVSAADGVEGDVRSKGALEILLDLLDLYPTLDGAAPLMPTYSVAGWRVINRREATHALRVIVGGVGMDPLQYALHSGRIGGATQLAAQGATNVQIQRAGRWKSLAFMVYVRAGGEGADFVSQALTQHTESRV